jgi:hypothetical protein
MAVFLYVVFALGAAALLIGLGVAVVRRIRDRRTPEERRALTSTATWRLEPSQ